MHRTKKLWIALGLVLSGDAVFLLGVGSLVWFMVGLKTGWSVQYTANQSQHRKE